MERREQWKSYVYSLFIIQINMNIIKSWRLSMQEYAFHENSYRNSGGKLADPLWSDSYTSASHNLQLFDILQYSASQPLSPCLLIIRLHTKVVRHIKDVTYQMIEIIKRIMLTWRDQEEDGKKCWDFLHFFFILSYLYVWREMIMDSQVQHLFIQRD